MTISGYVPAIGERDLNKIVRSIRNLYENAPDTASVDAAKTDAEAYADSAASQNAIINGAMEIWQRGTGSKSCAVGSRTFLPDRWYVNPSGAACTQLQSLVVPTNARSRFSLDVIGATSVTTVLIGQRVMSWEVPSIKRAVCIQAQIYNGTGADFTPSLLLGTPAAENNFTTVTNKLTQNLQSCSNGQYTQVNFVVDISGYANIDKGLQAEFQIPSGSLNSNVKDVKITEVAIVPASAVVTFPAAPREADLARCYSHYVKTFPYATAPSQNLGVFTGCFVAIPPTSAAGAGSIHAVLNMGGTPTVTTYNPMAANSNWWDSVASASRTVGVGDICDSGVRLVVNVASTIGSQHFIHYTAEWEP